MNNKATDWFNEVPSVPDPWQDNKPKLTQSSVSLKYVTLAIID